MEHCFHIARRGAWEAAQLSGRYEVSTLEKTLAEEGFIHMSFADQVAGTFARFYAGERDLVLLEIDPRRVGAEIKVENGFPHLYGPLVVEAVVAADRYAGPAGGAQSPPAGQ